MDPLRRTMSMDQDHRNMDQVHEPPYCPIYKKDIIALQTAPAWMFTCAVS